jgi:hypothetical protein
MGRETAHRLPSSASHFVLTRFNVRNFYHVSEPTDTWLRERLHLFETYCLPSMAGQTNKDFRWLVLCDSFSPDWFRAEIQRMAGGVFEPVFLEGAFNAAAASGIVVERCDSPYVITTRLDNDDAVARDFVDEIQHCFRGQTSEFVNLVNGAQYSKRKVYLRPYTQNPFCSLIEEISNKAPATVFISHHYAIQDYAPVRNVATKHPMWLQIIHEGNLLNEVVGLRIPAGRIVPHFACQLDVEDRGVALFGDRLTGGLRILWRLVRKPARIRELVRVFTSQRSVGSI